MFPKTMTDIGHKLADDAVVIVQGRVDKREDTPKLIAIDVEVFEGIVDGRPAAAHPAAAADASRRALDRPAEGAAGASSRASRGCSSTSATARCCACPTAHCVETGTGLVGELRVLLGPDAVVG